MRLGSFAVVVSALLGGSAWAATGDILVVTGSNVNVRSGPSQEAAVQMQVGRNQQVIEITRQGAWVRAEIPGTGGEEGWIHSSLLAPSRAAADAPATAPARTLPREQPASPAVAVVPDPAASPENLVGIQRFRESVEYLNSRALEVAGVNLFTEVQPAGAGVVQVKTTAAWSTVPPAGQRSYLNTLVNRWAAAKEGEGAVSVQIVDPSGKVVAEQQSP